MSEGPLQVEATGETVGEAKWSALRELEKLSPGLDKAAVRFEVLSEGERGLLGVGYSPARVLASAEAEAARPRAPQSYDSALGERVADLVERIVDGLGIRCRVNIEEDDETITASCTGGNLGLLIGRHGQTIDAIQYLVNAIVAREQGELRKAVVVDASGYRARREATLATVARRAAERALATGAAVHLEPMTAVERKIVHVQLQDHEGISTRSDGTEPNRFVVVEPTANGADPHE